MSTVTDVESAVRRAVLSCRAADVGSEARSVVRSLAPLLPEAEVDAVVGRLMARREGFGVLEPLLADPLVTDVLVNAGREVWVERRGQLERVPIELEPGEAEHLIEVIVAPLGLRIDRSSPLVDARLPDGSRVHAVIPPLAVDGPCMAIRRFATHRLELEAFTDAPTAEMLRAAVRDRRNLVVVGGTGTGKTTLLNALASALPPGERVVTIEDAAELRLPGEHVVRLEARPANADGLGEIAVRALVRAALRMRPDRIVVGEVRGGEALDMLTAMSTGHEGSMSTCHANGPLDALRRLETMVLFADSGLPLDAVRDHLHAALDLVIHVVRRPTGERTIASVGRVVGGVERIVEVSR